MVMLRLSPPARRFVVSAVVAVLAAAVVGLAVWFRGTKADQDLDQAVALIESADRLVLEVDQVIRSQVTSQSTAPASRAATRAAEAAALLERAVASIDEVLPRLRGDGPGRATDLREAATSRLDMLAQAPSILDVTIKAASALPLARTSWDHVLAADRLSDRAVASYNKLTAEGVRRSQRLNKQAARELAAAREGFAKAEAVFPEAGFERYLAYVDLRIQLNGLSQRSDADWLAGRLEQANVAIASYNELDARAVAAAKELPASPEKAIADAYTALAGPATDEYYRARARATAADARLRER